MNFSNHYVSAVIYDDHRLFAHSFAGFLERLGIFQQVRAVSNEADALRALANLAAEGQVCFFLDYLIGEDNSLNLFNDARRISKRIKVAIITGLNRSATIAHILSYKPDAIISKSSGADVIIECLDAIVAKQQYLCPEITHLISGIDADNTRKPIFSRREIEILSLFDQGLSIAAAAEKAHLSPFTIINHRSNMMKKSGTKSIVELLAYARKNNIL